MTFADAYFSIFIGVKVFRIDQPHVSDSRSFQTLRLNHRVDREANANEMERLLGQKTDFWATTTFDEAKPTNW